MQRSGKPLAVVDNDPAGIVQSTEIDLIGDLVAQRSQATGAGIDNLQTWQLG